MKGKTLLTLFILVVISLITASVFMQIKHTEKQLLTPKSYVQVNEKYFSLLLPDYFVEGKTTNNNGWIIRNFYLKGVATFRIAKYNSKQSNFNQLAKNYFNIKDFSKNKAVYNLKNGIGFYKKIRAVENGVFAMEKYKKSVKYFYFFTLNEKLYWLDFYPKSTLTSYKTIFDNILTSMKFADGKGVDSLFKKQLKTVCFESYLLFCQPFEALIALFALIVVLVWVIIATVSRKMGEKPSDQVLAELNPYYTEQNVDMATQVRNKVSFWSGFLAISSEYLVIYRFKKELIRIPLNDSRIQIKKQVSFFGSKYVEISLLSNEFYKRKNFFYKRPHKIRIYSKDTSQIMTYF